MEARYRSPDGANGRRVSAEPVTQSGNGCGRGPGFRKGSIRATRLKEGLRSAQCSLGVVPANAGTHSHRLEFGEECVIHLVSTGTQRGMGPCVRRDDIDVFFDSTVKQRDDTLPRSRGAMRPRFAVNFSHPRDKRAQGKPDARCTRGLVCEVVLESCTRAYRAAEAIRLSLRDALRIIRDHPGDRALLPPSPAAH